MTETISLAKSNVIGSIIATQSIVQRNFAPDTLVTIYVTTVVAPTRARRTLWPMNVTLPTLLQTVRDADPSATSTAALADALGVTPRAARVCCQRLRAIALSLESANDGARSDHGPDGDRATAWLRSVRLGARLLTVEGGGAVADAAARILARLDGLADNDDVARLVTDAELRGMVTRAVTERLVLSIDYWSAEEHRHLPRDIEPLSLTHADGHWTVLAWCRARRDLRSFRFDRVRDARLTNTHYEPRQGLSLERFIQRQKAIVHQRLAG